MGELTMSFTITINGASHDVLGKSILERLSWA
jgi:hypothetical protein